jgi:hypothetical protein
LLYRHRSATVTRKDLVNVWNVRHPHDAPSTTIAISAKIEAGFRKPWIVAVKGAGYAWGDG